MILSNENLLNLPVYTKSNQHLGQIHDFGIDSDTQTIFQYHVRGSNIIKNIIQNNELLIHHSQVIEITKEKMIVDDNLETEQEVSELKAKKFSTRVREPVGAMSSGAPRV